MKTIALLGAAAVLATLAACGPLPPGHPPIQPNASQGGGDAYLRIKQGEQPINPSYRP